MKGPTQLEVPACDDSGVHQRVLRGELGSGLAKEIPKICTHRILISIPGSGKRSVAPIL